ncbi:MAG: hypothetical protein ABW252_22850 [Polyangiales bacterium]
MLVLGGAASLGAGCAGEQHEPTTDPHHHHTDDEAAQQATAPVGIPEECRGFSFDEILYSPGGSTLPNKCQPFHPTLNNPYAVRCVDAWPWYKTKYRGDEFCILPPPPDKGMQVGFHPQGLAYWDQISKKDLSGYESPTAEWVVKPGGEETLTYHAPSPNKETKKYYRTYFRMRTGSHHNIISMHNSTSAPGWMPNRGEALPAFFDPTAGAASGILGGQERPDDNTPVTLDRPPEDEGMYTNFPANANVFYNTHFFNIGREPALKEGWVNVWFEEEGSVYTGYFMGLEFGQVIGLNIPPNQSRDLHYAFSPQQKVRLVRFFGHRHVWTTNFTGWVERKDGKVETIYQSFDWMDMPTFRYDSVVQNPVPSADKRVDGATSGILTLEAGDKLHFNCHIEYTEARAQEEGAPSPRTNGNLRFANQALTAEMCIAFGTTSLGSLGMPAVARTPIPDIAKK